MVDKQTLDEAKKDLEKTGYSDRLDDFYNQGAALNRATSVRVFEARIPGGTKCFLKEYLPIGVSFGRRELGICRKLVVKWNELGKDIDEVPPFPLLLGSLRTDERIENSSFRENWSRRFPRTRPPDAGNIWLVFRWDETSFRSLKTFPPLPQIVEGFDYFRKDERLMKRWRFIRKIMRCGLESLDFLHRAGYCHNSISSDSIWMTTTNQQNIENLAVCFTDLGACQKFSDLGPTIAREAAMDDMYKLGFVMLELVFASFSDDNLGARMARTKIGRSRHMSDIPIYHVHIFNRYSI